MKNLSNITLFDNQRQAIIQAKKEIESKYPVVSTIIFGSAARGEANDESDIDILVLTKRPVSHRERHDIYAMVTKINLEYNTNISVLIAEYNSWENGFYSVLPIKHEVSRDGVVF